MMEKITRKKKRDKQKEINFFGEFLRIKNHFFKDINSKLKKVKDKRHQSYVEYGTDILLFSVIMKNLTAIESMKKMTIEFNKDECINNVAQTLGYEDLVELPHHDTINNFLKRLNPIELEKIRDYMIRELFKKRCLEQYRLLDKYWTIAVDATGLVSYRERHCEHCLKQEHKNKETGEIEKTIYFHYVLEAKLVIGNMVFSIDTEFIENEGEEYEKQDCEINAFKRLAQRLKKKYKRLPICILGDSLYGVEPIFQICNKNNWKYILRFKEGRTKSIWTEYQELKEVGTNKINDYTWVNSIDYKDSIVNVVEANLIEKEKEKNFLYITNLEIKKNKVEEIIAAGRSRWKIENEGFKNQKCIKNNIEHQCCEDYTAMKNHYLLVQIAEILRQLFEQGYELIRSLKAGIKEISSRLLESFRRELITVEDINKLNKRIQIRYL
jgi:hypothetical protein